MKLPRLHRWAWFALPLLLVLLVPQLAHAQSTTQHTIPRTESRPDVDGIVEPGEWVDAVTIMVDIETDPGDSVPADVSARALVMEDGETLFVAFIAEDPDPEQIRAIYQDRDDAYRDDWMAIFLDTFNDSRRAYEFFVNPFGVQIDAIYDDVVGREDDSWNAIWDSIGRITDTGYEVELAIPLRQLRFPRANGLQTWSIEGVRHYPRNRRTWIRSNPRDRNISCNLCQMAEADGFADLRPGRNLEVVPTITSTTVETRDPDDGDWEHDDTEFEGGLDVRWGIAQDMYLNATLNPDFSQVEADSAQLDINNTFSLFYPERRTFFLDGADYFRSFFNLVHTRNIADPDYGAKLTGKTGRHTYGVMSANDETTSFVMPGSLRSSIANLDVESDVNVARYRYDIFDNSTVGAVVTDRRGDGYSNSVYSFDAVLRPSESDTIYLQNMHSRSEYPGQIQTRYNQSAELDDWAHVIEYRHNDARWDSRITYQDWGDDFRADMGFINRVGYRFFLANLGHTWRWDGDNNFLTRFRINADYDRTEDQDGLKLEEEFEVFINANGPLQSYFNGLFGGSKTYWNGKYFDEQFNQVQVGFSPNADLQFGFLYRLEDIVDFANTRLGRSVRIRPEIGYRWGDHLQLELDYTRQEFDVDGGRLFLAHLADFRTTYQFNSRSFLRLTLQYSDNERNQDLYINPVDHTNRELTTQLLYSYKLNAVTRFFIGYSDAGFQDDNYDRIERTNRTFFVKFSYAWLP